MVITYYGASCFKVQFGETVLVFNPPSKDSTFKSPRFQANVVLISANHKDYNGWENLSGKKEGEAPFIIDSPGEYEINGIYIKGIFSGLNTIYILMIEDISLCHLGAFTEREIGSDLKEEISEIDILLMPMSASQIISEIEPKIIIPAHYQEPELKKFLKEFGNGGVKPEEKLAIKKKDLGEQKNQIVVLEAAL